MKIFFAILFLSFTAQAQVFNRGPNANCGQSGTIIVRINDCIRKNSGSSTYDGTAYGQSVWKLVTRTAPVAITNPDKRGREVWLDQKTGIIWSSLVANDLNWCKASGSNNIPGNKYAEVDPDGICTNPHFQNTSGLAISACYDDGGIKFSNQDPNIDNAGKAGLGFSSSPKVDWRLPTLADFRQAEIDGYRVVFPDVLGNIEWSATLDSSNREKSWVINQPNGAVMSWIRTSGNGGYAVRCMARIQ